jgi:hypothetical protein
VERHDGPCEAVAELATKGRAADSNPSVADVASHEVAEGLSSVQREIAGIVGDIATMAWAGKASSAQKTMLSIKSRRHARPLPPPENPLGVPKAVMKALSQEQLSSDPVAFNARLQELLAAYKSNGV